MGFEGPYGRVPLDLRQPPMGVAHRRSRLPPSRRADEAVGADCAEARQRGRAAVRLRRVCGPAEGIRRRKSRNAGPIGTHPARAPTGRHHRFRRSTTRSGGSRRRPLAWPRARRRRSARRVPERDALNRASDAGRTRAARSGGHPGTPVVPPPDIRAQIHLRTRDPARRRPRRLPPATRPDSASSAAGWQPPSTVRRRCWGNRPCDDQSAAPVCSRRA